jgi:hypothetical protein
VRLAEREADGGLDAHLARDGLADAAHEAGVDHVEDLAGEVDVEIH